MSAKRLIRCAVYTRKSTEEGLEQDFNSLDAQREACCSYIASQKAEGWIALSSHYDDGGYSGGTLDRPALKRLLVDIEDNKIDVVLVYKIDRLSRALLDFSKLVEVFDRTGVTFVSITQSFNTTTSMGRLTLNVLLSFAQFERELTGERIRDKVAASKKKGIWMGGNPPLGYDVAKRKLVVNKNEAETIRLIFQRYLDLGCVRLLSADLRERGVASKRRTLKNGETMGGRPIERSALYLILNNRTYLGETLHKGKSYPGEHEAIVPHALFEAVQIRLAALAPAVKATSRTRQDTPYAGLLFDETGTPMLPTYTVKRPGLRYRYYVSRPSLKGERSGASISRIPAPTFESFVNGVLRRFGLLVADQKAFLRRIDILWNSVVIRMDRAAAMVAGRSTGEVGRADIDAFRRHLSHGETLQDGRSELILTLPVSARFRGARANVWPSDEAQAASRQNRALIKSLARAHRWRQMLLDGEATSVEALARRYGLDRCHAARTLTLGFLSSCPHPRYSARRTAAGLVPHPLAERRPAAVLARSRDICRRPRAPVVSIG